MELKDWFNEKDYGIGLTVLANHSRNREMHKNLSRKSNPEKLEYELRKIAILQGVILEQLAPRLPEPELPTELMESQSERVMVRTKDEVTMIPVVNDNWPKSIKERWEQNRDNYKIIRSLHEKLKLMENASDEDRVPLVQSVSDLSDKIRANWELIDNWVPGQEEPAQEVPAIDHKRINANRKFISTNLKTLTDITNAAKYEEIKIKIQQRVDELKQAGEELESFTSEKLKKAGIQC